jgi:predicted transposase YbfD/YdcC
MEGFDDLEPAMPTPSRLPRLLDHFSALRDPRQRWRVVYPLPEILLLVLCATLSGMEDFTEVRLWGEERLGFLRRFLPYERGVPSHDTLNDVVNGLDAELFRTCFASWVEALQDEAPDIVAIDGKTSRRCHARGEGREALHMVSAWASRQRLVLGQEAVADKTNEITAIPALLERLELHGALVTIDAIGTQAEIARAIVGRGADYLLGLKANQPALLADVVDFFADPPAGMVEPAFQTTDGDHGRVEERRHLVCRDVEWLTKGRGAPGARFAGLSMIGMVETRVERAGIVGRERRYYVSSASLDVQAFAAAVRAHWHVENRLHWVLDVVFHDDLVRLRTGNGPANMAVIRHMAMNLVRNPKDKHSLKNRRKLANLNQDYLENLIRQTSTLT